MAITGRMWDWSLLAKTGSKVALPTPAGEHACANVLGGRPRVLRRDRPILVHGYPDLRPRPLEFLLLAPGLLSASCGGAADSAETPPHLLLVSVDCLRADHLSAYGYPRETSPRLDRFAAEGVRFERAYSTTSWTLPSHLSMLTGLPVSAHGIDDDRLWLRRDGDGEPIPAPLRAAFVSERLSDAGYATAGFYTWKYLEPRFGFGPGFDVYERLGHNFYSHPEVGPEFERLRQANDVDGMKALAEEWPALFDDTHPSSPETIDRAIEWLDGHVAATPDRPFFLFVHLFDVHDPYTPPEPYFSMFDPDYEGPIDGRRVTSPDSPVHAGMAKRDLERLVSLYDGAIRFVDAEIGRLLDHLDRLGVSDDTLAVITADHGEEFFEHGQKTHRNQLYLESVGVPLLMRWPRGLPEPRVVAGNAGLVDIAPTLLAAAGLSPAAPTAGVDLLPFARGERENPSRTYLSELVRFEGDDPVPRRLLSVARGDRQTLLETRGRAPWAGRTFDLPEDPGQRAGDVAASVWIEEELAALRDALTRLRAANPARGVAGAPLSELELAELAAAGYAGGDEAIEGGEPTERLSMDGGVWPDE